MEIHTVNSDERCKDFFSNVILTAFTMLVGEPGIEPGTSRVSLRMPCALSLSYSPIKYGIGNIYISLLIDFLSDSVPRYKQL